MNTALIPTPSSEILEMGTPGPPCVERTSQRYVFTDADRCLARTPEALDRARRTRKHRADQRRSYARKAFREGHPVKRIADDLGLADATVEGFVSDLKRYGRGFIALDPVGQAAIAEVRKAKEGLSR